MRHFGYAMITTTVLCGWSLGCTVQSDDGCDTDSDCKGDRLCMSGECIAPPGGAGGSGGVAAAGAGGGGQAGAAGQAAAGAAGVAVGGYGGEGEAGQGGSGPVTCADAGGMTTPDGACFITCMYDTRVPLNDAFENCKPMQMVCGHQNYCTHTEQKCYTNEDCGVGFKCIGVPRGVGLCRFSCNDGVTCPPGMTCTTEDPYNILGVTHVCEKG